MDKPTWRARWQYWFDNWMSRGTVAIMALLGAATVVFVFVVALIVIVFHAFPEGADDGDFWDIVWGNLMRTLDPGTMGADAGWGFRFLMLLVTIGGLIIVASLIGIVSGGFDNKMAELRKGRSRVLERDHTLILGWSGKLLPIVSEICTANESRKRAVIVILADRDKVDMEETLRDHLKRRGRTEIVCRSGDPMSTLDLQMASPGSARSVIILPPDGEKDSDAAVIKIAMALTHDAATTQSAPPRIVAELRDRRHLEAARLVGRGRAQWLLARELITRMTVQTTRQGGLSAVYTELLDFDGDEIYFTHQPDFSGLTYLDAQLRFASATVMGVERDGTVELNPSADYVLRVADRLVVIAADDDTIRTAPRGVVDSSAISHATAASPTPEHTLILGCNSSLQMIIDELAAYVAPGSTICIAADVVDPGIRTIPGVQVVFTSVDSTSRAVLDSLNIVAFDHVVVLAYRDALDVQAADAKTLVTLLHLRDIADREAVDINIVSEMLDDRNRELAEVTKADDFIVSDRLVSLMLSQISENESLIGVFNELFSSTGIEIYLRPAALYVNEGVTVDFHTVIAAASERGETAIGYRLASEAHSRDQRYGVHVNPVATDRWRPDVGDAVIVLAENSTTSPTSAVAGAAVAAASVSPS